MSRYQTDTPRVLATVLAAITFSLAGCNEDGNSHRKNPGIEEPAPSDDDDTTPTPTPEEQDKAAVEASRDTIEIGFTWPDKNINRVTDNLRLPDYDGANGVAIHWHSSNPVLLANDGTVTRPPFDYGPSEVTLTATFSKGEQQVSRDFQVNVARKYVYFVKDEKIYRTDGTFDGTDATEVVSPSLAIPEAPKNGGYLPMLGDTIFFVAREFMHPTEGRTPSYQGGELWSMKVNDQRVIHITSFDIALGELSGINGPLEWEYVGEGEDMRLRFHALDVAPGTNRRDILTPCSDVQIWETDGVWRQVGLSWTLNDPIKINGCPEPNPLPLVVVQPLNEGQQISLQNLVTDFIIHEESKIVVEYLSDGSQPITSGTLAKAMLDFGDYLRPHVETQIRELNALIASPPEGVGAAMVAQLQRSRAALQEALDKYIGEDQLDINKQEFVQRMTSSGAHAEFMGAGTDPEALSRRFNEQEKADLEMRMALMAPLVTALRDAVLEGKTLSISQKNIAARVANLVNTKRQFLGEELTRLEMEYFRELAIIGSRNPFALKTLPDIALKAEEIAAGRLTAAAVGAGAGAATGTALVLGIKLGGAAIFPFAKAGSAALLAGAGGATAVIGVTVGVWVIGAVAVAMLIEEAENKAAFEAARARANTYIQADLGNLAMNDGGFGQADYFAGFTAMYAEVR